MSLAQPAWLLLAVPLVVLMRVYRSRSRAVDALRALLFLLVVLALARPVVRLPSRAGRAVLVLDRSASMPPGSEAQEKEVVELVQKARPGDGELAVVSFGERSAVELSPGAGAFAGLTRDVGSDGSDLAGALETALSLVPRGAAARLLVVSDGRATGRSPAGPAFAAAARGIAIDYRHLARPGADDVAVERFEGPVSTAPGEGFLLTAWVRAPLAQDAAVELRRGGRVIAAGSKPLAGGLTRLTFRDLAGEAGTQSYELTVTPRAADPVPENNRARLLVGVEGGKPLLVVSRKPVPALAELLSAGKLPVKTAGRGELDTSLEGLSRYSAVLLEDVPATDLGRAGMETLAAWVSDGGGGLMMTGGRSSYGPGGYFKSPLEAVLPVSMELRQEHRKFSVAMVVALDRSGSMAVPVGGGRTKMDLADLSTAQVLDLLSPMDELGVIAVDSSPHTIIELQPVPAQPGAVRDKILSVDSMGGGIFIYEALAAAARMMVKAQAGTKHILLFADAADSEEPGDYKELLKKLQESGITVSVIGLGTPSDPDADLLRDIAKRGSGSVYFTDDAKQLPSLFAQDTFVVARSAFVDEPTRFRLTGGLAALSGRTLSAPPALGGYNLCYLREGANLAAVTEDEYRAPVVASWQAGAGRVAVYTGEADGRYTGEVARWKDAGELFTSLGRWVSGSARELPDGMALTQRLEEGLLTLELDLDPSGALPPFAGVPTVTALRGRTGQKPESVKLPMEWSEAGRLVARLPVGGRDTALASVEIPGGARVTLAPVCSPYSPEMKSGGESGETTLRRLATATGGVERLTLSDIWRDMPWRRREVSLAPWLLLAASVALLLEVLERRTSLLSLRLAARPRREPHAAEAARPLPAEPRRQGAATTPAPPPADPAAHGRTDEAAPEPPALLGALRDARRRARGRLDRDH